MSQLMYLFILLLALLLAYVARRNKKISFVYVLILLLTITAGLRGQHCGVDTPSYYYSIMHGFPYSWMFREEGFRLVANFFMNTYNNPQLMFLFCAFITNLLIILRLWDFREDAKFDFMVLIYLLMFYSNSMNIMRQYVAVALVFYGTRYLKNRKMLFLPFFVMAFYFHRSSLLSIGYFIIALWEGFTKKQKQVFTLPIVGVLGAAIVYVRFSLASDVESYSAQGVSNINITFFYLLFATMLALLLYWTKKRIIITNNQSGKGTEDYVIDNSIIICTIIGLAFSSLSMFLAFVGRSGLYYSIYYVVFWGIACSKFKSAFFNKILILVYAVYVFGLVVLRNDCNLFPFVMYLY